jgi:hypothetical protein
VASGFAPNPNQSVRALAVDEGTLYAGGFFTTIGQGTVVAREKFAALDPATGRPTAFAPAPIGDFSGTTAVFSLLAQQGTLVIGGGFDGVGTLSHGSFAMFHAPPENATKPAISGGFKRGDTQTCSPGAWTHAPTAFTFSWRRNGAAIAGGPTYKTTFADDARLLTCVVTATNPGGNGAAASSAARTFDFTRPAITKAKLRRKKFRRSSKRTPVNAIAKKGTTLQFTLSEAASVAIRVEKRGKNKKYKRVRTLTRKNLKKGARKVAFSGRVGSKRLSLGAYRFSIVATDAAGNASRTKRLTFRIVRR